MSPSQDLRKEHMLIFFIILAALGILFFFADLAMDGEGGLMILGMILAIIGVIGTVSISATRQDNRHKQAIHDIRAAGWHFKDDNVDGSSTVTIHCVTFDIIKVDGKYIVAAKRPAEQGGGHIILDPAKTEERLNPVCFTG